MSSSSLIPEECVGFHTNWLENASSDEKIEDLDTMDIIKALMSFHHEMIRTGGFNYPSKDENDKILCVLDRLNIGP